MSGPPIDVPRVQIARRNDQSAGQQRIPRRDQHARRCTNRARLCHSSSVAAPTLYAAATSPVPTAPREAEPRRHPAAACLPRSRDTPDAPRARSAAGDPEIEPRGVLGELCPLRREVGVAASNSGTEKPDSLNHHDADRSGHRTRAPSRCCRQVVPGRQRQRRPTRAFAAFTSCEAALTSASCASRSERCPSARVSRLSRLNVTALQSVVSSAAV
jgi:hypothetical protein